MKLLVITAVKEYTENIRDILMKNKVCTFSYTGVTGYRDSTRDDVGGNWFGTDMNKSQSVLFFAFVTNAVGGKVYENVRDFNQNIEVISKIHIAMSPVEKSNSLDNQNS